MALLLTSVFVLFALIGRVLIQLYTTGNSGIRLANPVTEPLAAVAGAAFSLSFAVGIIMACLDFAQIVSLPRFELAYLNEFAFAIGIAGITIVVVAQLQMGAAWRIGVDSGETTALITHGLYQKSRNPIYFGLGLYWVGLCVLLPHLTIWILATICWLCIELIVRKVEEPYLARVHGTIFDAYLQHTNRYFIGW